MRVNRVVVRVIRRGDKYHVIGRKTTMICHSFPEAWDASVPYFAGRKY